MSIGSQLPDTTDWKMSPRVTFDHVLHRDDFWITVDGLALAPERRRGGQFEGGLEGGSGLFGRPSGERHHVVVVHYVQTKVPARLHAALQHHLDAAIVFQTAVQHHVAKLERLELGSHAPACRFHLQQKGTKNTHTQTHTTKRYHT